MRRIKYPDPVDNFLEEYKKIFEDDLESLQNRWDGLREEIAFLRTTFPKDLNEILTANYSRLLNYYTDYKSYHSFTADQTIRLEKLFNYDKYQPKIAKFFMEKAKELDITTCFYCETAYINIFEVDDYLEQLVKLNTLPDDKLMKLLKTSSVKTLNKIKSSRPYQSKEDFNLAWKNCRKNNKDKKFEEIFTVEKKRNHFDLDHVLDKGRCPIIALSVMNFVPSCQVCNEKLKRSLVLGDILNDQPIEKLSPTSPQYDFYNQVKFSLDLDLGSGIKPESLDAAYAKENPDRFNLNITCLDKDYDSLLRIFRLKERYVFHKMEGLHWLAMKAKYTDNNIKMLAATMKSDLFSEIRIKEDIFQKEYDDKRHPCFMKLKQDILS